ncbi:AAA family ATPase [Desulfobacula sp.]|uniref:ATP-dependent nuclease n=1 Tax=Desulfobacula sp. TaxID=2593537 RepID=UPI0026059F92|nr:AAA family ATPase [Desulfobacula sp.]
MKIKFVEIQNFRKLKSCRIEFGDKETVLVGANNSGKTSAMDALILFLKQNRHKEITTTDITLSNWYGINEIGSTWVKCNNSAELNLDIGQWLSFLPSIDIWIDVDMSQIHYVSHLIPTLSWNGGTLGVRLSFEPRDIEKLYKEFKEAFNSATETALKNSSETKLSLWPQSLKEFLEKRLYSRFKIKPYLLDPSKLADPVDGVANLQKLPDNFVSLDIEPFKGLFKIDIINAQRGFSDAKTSDITNSGNSIGNLSSQLRGYFDKHLNPYEQPTLGDLDALTAIENAKNEFDKKLKTSFRSAISELESLGYPGFSDPQITLTSKINPIDGLSHDSAVQFSITKGKNSTKEPPLFLPEKYNGLGYQNLVSMVFKLIRFRDEWMRKGKAGKSLETVDNIIEPLHLVFIEEPEAHLHAQVQQVFIKKAYNVLRNHKNLKDSAKHSTQMIVSTHSSHIAHENDFGCLRYFRKNPANNKNEVPNATVVNLSKTFGQEDDTSKFATRYLKTTHCDLFFADAVILVEGPAERILFPHFISQKYPELDSRYITILEIGGSHAHRLKPLIEDLGLITLVITDIDSINSDSINKIQPERNKSYRSGNYTLKNWIPQKENLDELLDFPMDKKVSENALVRVAYQYPFKITWDNKNQEVIPYTFEDALTFSNVELFRDLTKPTGLIKKMSEALSKPTLPEAMTAMFDALGTGKKAEMALDLLYLQEPSGIEPPKYIAEGLEWLQEKLEYKDNDYLGSGTTSQEVLDE